MFSAKPISGAEWGRLAVALSLGAAVLWWQLGAQAYLWDEYVTLMFTQAGWRELVVQYWDLDTHRPVYYALQKLWNSTFGDSVVAVRSLPAALVLLSIPAVFAFVRVVQGPKVAFAASLLAATSPMFFYQGREIRMYCITTLMMTICLAATLVLAQNARGAGMLSATKQGALWLVFTLSAAIGFYGHAVTLLVVFVLGVWALICAFSKLLPWSFFWKACAAAVLYGVLIAPAILPLLSHTSTTLGDSFWAPKPTLGHVYTTMASVYDYPFWMKPVVLALMLAGLWHLRKMPHVCTLMALMVFGVPLVIWAISFYKPIFLLRPLIWTGYIGVILMAYGTFAFGKKLQWPLLAGVLAVQLVMIVQSYPTQGPQDQYTAITPALQALNIDAAVDTVILTNQGLEPGLRWHNPNLFAGDSFSFAYGKWNTEVIEAAYKAKAITPAETRTIQLNSGRVILIEVTEDPKNLPQGYTEVMESLMQRLNTWDKVSDSPSATLRVSVYKRP
ncbi:glycosyltransferase family 39 protein [Algirhabdus cladophorae]|uniref:glycosyltransferase family 39 protein n=1 Tax=Algirhabdus cladophorae TaxID=3377108 RepID=UPI003B84A776